MLSGHADRFFLEVLANLIAIEQFLQVVLVALPILQVVIPIEVELFVLRFVFSKGAAISLLQSIRFGPKSLNDVVLLFDQNIELF